MILKKRTSLQECGIILLLIGNEIFKLFGYSFVCYLLFILMVFELLLKRIRPESFLIYSLFISNVYVQFMGVPIYLAYRKSFRVSKFKECNYFLVLIAISGALNCIYYSGNPFQVVFQFFVYYCVLQFSEYGTKNFVLDKYYRLFDELFVMQLVVLIIQYCYYQRFGDYSKGTFVSAHHLGIFILVYILILFRRNEKNSVLIPKIVFSGFILYLSDAKHVWMLFILSFIICSVLSRARIKKNQFLLLSVVLLIIIVAGVFGINWDKISNINGLSFVRTYIFNNEYNKKFVFFSRTFDQMMSINGLFGFGPGLYGSQIAITMGKAYIYPWESTFANYNYMISPYRNAIQGLMTEAYTKFGISMSSMVLGYPLVSYIGIIAELGCIGYYLFAHILDKIFKDCDKTLLVFFLLICIFDIYFEVASVFVLVLIGTELARNQGFSIWRKKENVKIQG